MPGEDWKNVKIPAEKANASELPSQITGAQKINESTHPTESHLQMLVLLSIISWFMELADI